VAGDIPAAREWLGRARIATTANLAYDRLIGYLEEMVRAGLVTEVRKPRLTPEGREFLQRYTTLTEMLSRFGLR